LFFIRINIVKKLEMDDLVILVDESDNVTGTAGKMEAHRKGLLHRAISVFIFNSQGEVLLQQRALQKYHSAGLWSNTCCSHPLPGESNEDAAIRRLMEEMGLKASLKYISSFRYRTDFSNGLIENELDHVFYGITDQVPVLNIKEAQDWKYMNLTDLKNNIELYPEKYTSWLKICIDKKIISRLI
jgi:isopentenyl-diphosphate delta-isomerase